MTPRSLRGHRKTFYSCFVVPEGKTGIPDFFSMISGEIDIFQILIKVLILEILKKTSILFR